MVHHAGKKARWMAQSDYRRCGRSVMEPFDDVIDADITRSTNQDPLTLAQELQYEFDQRVCLPCSRRPMNKSDLRR